MTGVWCTALELSQPLPPSLTAPVPGRHSWARVLVRLHGAPMGFIELPLSHDTMDVDELVRTVSRTLLDAVNEHLVSEGLTPVDAVHQLPAAAPSCTSTIVLDEPVTVVICTRNRAETLQACLQPMRELSFPALEILVIDNAPADDSTRLAFEEFAGDDPRFRYIAEPRPGLSCARNRGLREAAGTVVAYTDDDVAVDPDWVRALVAPFADPAVACATGLVCTAAIDGPAERYFDARVSWADSLSPVDHRIGGATDHGLFPYATGSYGTGASFAVRAKTFRDLGGFDEALGAGTRTAGGEDLDAFVRVILAGYTLAYRPAAIVWHRHRADLAGLRQQIFAYGTGTSAFIAKQMWVRSTRGEVLRRVPQGVRKVMSNARTTRSSLEPGARPGAGPAAPATVSSGADVPAKALLLRELAGLAAGPVLYARARRAIPPPGPG